MNDRTSKPPRLIMILLILAATAALPYLQALRFQFLNYDDNLYVTGNYVVQQGLSWNRIAWAFATVQGANWHPLTMLSHMLDCDLYRQADGTQWAGGHHLTSVCFHAVNTVLVFGVLHALTGAIWRSAMVAALFALHPLHVESVAWISERKDVLSAFFGLAAMWAYAHFVRRPSIWRYACIAACLAMSLLAKPMLVTLPFVLLLLDFWPLRRFGISDLNSHPAVLWKLVVEKLPLFAMSAAVCAVTISTQSVSGAVKSLDFVPLPLRISNAIISYAHYLFEAFWPANLAVFYPLPKSIPTWPMIASGGLLLLISVIALALASSRRFLIVGWLWFLGTLTPVIGVIQVGEQARADRYTYFPLLGLFIMIVWSIPAPRSLPRRIAAAIGGLSATVLIALGATTWRQVSYWENSLTLFQHALKVTENNHLAHFCVGSWHLEHDNLPAAFEHLRAALQIKPRFAEALTNFGLVLEQQNRPQDAEACYREAADIYPEYAEAHHNLANVLLQSNRLDEAIDRYRRALELTPFSFESHYNLGQALLRKDRLEEAAQEFERVLQIRPDLAQAREKLDLIHRRQRIPSIATPP